MFVPGSWATIQVHANLSSEVSSIKTLKAFHTELLGKLNNLSEIEHFISCYTTFRAQSLNKTIYRQQKYTSDVLHVTYLCDSSITVN